jgi:hypothetical protein
VDTSPDSVDALLYRMLATDATNRVTAAQALEHASIVSHLPKRDAQPISEA